VVTSDPTNLCELGHVASAAALVARGNTRRQIAAAAQLGRIHRVARGIYACPHLDADSTAAARAGGAIDCVSALARHEKQWAGIAAPGVHLRVRPHHHVAWMPRGAVVHWSARLAQASHPLIVSSVDALLQAMRCLPPYDALACLESAMHTEYLDAAGLEMVLALAPLSMKGVLDRIDFGAGSGLETHARVKLVDAGHRVQTQVEIPGAGKIDILVDDCVALETDGKKWHGPERFMPDRTKDIRVEAWGIRSLRIGAAHVFEGWPETLATIERMVRDAQAARGSQQRRLWGTRG